MSQLVVHGGVPLSGEISIGGSKNAILPLMASTLLTDKTVHFSNVPKISDVDAMKQLLKSHGVEVDDSISGRLYLRARNPRFEPLDSEIGRTFRASVLLLGPLLARLGKARVYLPGGDDIDSRGRGVDFHITNLKAMKATVNVYPRHAHIDAEVNPYLGLQGAHIVLPKVSVGATQNTIMAACGANGTTTIGNASIEPETLDLVEFLRRMGATINVDQPNRTITIQGKPVQSYSASPMSSNIIKHAVIPDRIEAGTYAIAAAITGGKIELKMNVSDEVILNLLESEFWRLLASGMQITRSSPKNSGIIVVERLKDQNGQIQTIKPVSVKTNPYPGFPTDMHPQWAALMCFSDGSCWIEEKVFDSRFKYVEQLRMMGAGIWVDGRKVNITGGGLVQQYPNAGSTVVAPDIRAGAALILAALAKNGRTVISGIDHVDRGYEKFVEKFQSCGARMERRQ